MRLTKNFEKWEFESKDGATMPPEVLMNVQILAEQLQVIRDHIGKPIDINSGYRSPAHNKAVGGSKNSYHMKGMAADIVIEGMQPREVAATVTALMQSGKIKKGGIALYSTFVHYDHRGHHVRFK